MERTAAECNSEGEGDGDGVSAIGRAKNGDAQGARLAGGERDLGGERPAGGEGVTLEDPRPMEIGRARESGFLFSNRRRLCGAWTMREGRERAELLLPHWAGWERRGRHERAGGGDRNDRRGFLTERHGCKARGRPNETKVAPKKCPSFSFLVVGD